MFTVCLPLPNVVPFDQFPDEPAFVSDDTPFTVTLTVLPDEVVPDKVGLVPVYHHSLYFLPLVERAPILSKDNVAANKFVWKTRTENNTVKIVKQIFFTEIMVLPRYIKVNTQ